MGVSQVRGVFHLSSALSLRILHYGGNPSAIIILKFLVIGLGSSSGVFISLAFLPFLLLLFQIYDLPPDVPPSGRGAGFLPGQGVGGHILLLLPLGVHVKVDEGADGEGEVKGMPLLASSCCIQRAASLSLGVILAGNSDISESLIVSRLQMQRSWAM